MIESIREWMSYNTTPFEDVVIVTLIIIAGTQVMSFWCRGR